MQEIWSYTYVCSGRRSATKTVGAVKFKEQCLALLDRLDADGLIVTKHGKPVAGIVPYDRQHDHRQCADLIGSLRHKIRIRGDIMTTGLGPMTTDGPGTDPSKSGQPAGTLNRRDFLIQSASVAVAAGGLYPRRASGAASKDRLSVAVIGCGRLGQQYAEIYRALPQTDLVAIAEWNPERRKVVGERFGVKALYKDADA